MDNTKGTKYRIVDDGVYADLVKEQLDMELKNYFSAFSVNGKLFTDLKEIYKKKEVRFKNGDLIVRPFHKLLLPDLDKCSLLKFDKLSDYNKKNFSEKYPMIKGYTSELPTSGDCMYLNDYLKKKIKSNEAIMCVCDDYRISQYCGRVICFDIQSGQPVSPSTEKKQIVTFPVIRFNDKDTNEFISKIIMDLKLCPTELPEDSENYLSDLFLLMKSKKLYVTYEKSDTSEIYYVKYYSKKILNDLMSGKTEPFSSLHWNLNERLKYYYDTKIMEKSIMNSKEDLLNCEYNRAAIEPYEERILTDPNRGHWDLWMDEGSDVYTVRMEDTYMARNPKCDINEDGVIAIDFGTKSTIVVYQSDIEHSLPMGIGDGELSKEPSAKRYENPTMMQFVNLERFLENYRAKKGRPNTKWEDLPISHTAMDKFQNSSSEQYYSFLYQIKQWAGLREKQFRIQPVEGESIVLPSFMDLGEDDLNPIEIYAYYIGLYINNMRKGHGIFLDYYLSFPVTYEIKIREKIIASFRKGLMKSLPETIQNDPEIMARFRVNGDVSEPAAYAVCALQEYGFDPKDGEEIFYGIFDFGGGTTDFDFGLWTKSKKRRYDYKIENFGAGGDEFLGGENLLEMLAFDIFKENQDVMRKNGYTFTLAPKCTEFLGSDALLADSQEAEKNMHNLMEKLRPFWEISSESENKEVKDKQDEVILKVLLFDKEGKSNPNVDLKTTRSHINQFIEDKIREGVKNFFAALMLSFQSEKVKKPTTINILLAGNSCKSPVVYKVFEEEIVPYEKRIQELYGYDEKKNHFEIFPPLGTRKAYEKMEELGLPHREDDFEKPTGKTGVAFGLIQCRTGGTIERVTNVGANTEIPFQFFIGWRSKKNFDPIKGTHLLGKPDYDRWYQFIEADQDTFYLYYTTLPECVDGKLQVDGNSAVKRIKCSLDVTDEDAFVYIRATTPHSIEYTVSVSDNVEKDRVGEIFKKELG